MSNIKEPEKEVIRGGRRPHRNLTPRPIWEVIDEIMRDVPEVALSRLPEDGAEQHDHYLYGTLKKAPRES